MAKTATASATAGLVSSLAAATAAAHPGVSSHDGLLTHAHHWLQHLVSEGNVLVVLIAVAVAVAAVALRRYFRS